MKTETQKHYEELSAQFRNKGHEETAKFFADEAKSISNLGTDKYDGQATFWNMEYKNELRDASYEARKEVHNKFMQERLALDGVSERHEKIIEEIMEREIKKSIELEKINAELEYKGVQTMAVANHRHTMQEWHKSQKDGYDVYKNANSSIIDKRNLIQTSGNNAELEARGAFALALQKGWDIDKIDVRGSKAFKEAWAQEAEKYKHVGKKQTSAQNDAKFQKAWEWVADGLEYGVGYNDIIKEGEKKGVSAEITEDALALELLNRDGKISIPEKEIETMTHAQAKEYIDNANTTEAVLIKHAVYDRKEMVVQSGHELER